MFANSQYDSLGTNEFLGRNLNDVEQKNAPKTLYVRGSLDIPVPHSKVSIIGARKSSPRGIEAARHIAKTLVEKNVVIVSGLAEGIDTAAHKAAIDSGGKTMAVLGTPLNQTYPKSNIALQDEIMKNHLAVSQYPETHPILKKNFVLRNKTMALISDASVIVEAGDSSGALYQGWETLRLGRPLFIWHAMVCDSALEWPKKMLDYGAMELSDPTDIFETIY